MKVYSGLPREAYFAIADEARKQGIPFAGHVPFCVSAKEASAASQKTIEHLTGILRGCSSRETEILKAMQVGFTATLSDTNNLSQLRQQAQVILETYDDARANGLFADLNKNHTWQCPTLTVLHNMAFMQDPAVTNDSRLKYIPAELRSIWTPDKFFWIGRTAEDVVIQKRFYQKQLEVVGAMQRAGVRILAGTDSPNPYCFPGFSLHDELTRLSLLAQVLVFFEG